MERIRKCFGILIAVLLSLWSAAPAWAGTVTKSATISVTINSSSNVDLVRDTNSVTRGSATNIVFDLRDPTSPGYMYAPYQSETGKNWHLASVTANSASLDLTASVSDTVMGPTNLRNILKLYCGGFYVTGTSTPIAGTKSTDWELANGFSRHLNQAFVGTVPLNYQLNIAQVGPGAYNTGSITFTLTTP